MPDSTKSQQPKLLDQVRQVLRLHHYSIHTERSYVDWIVRFVRFHSMRSREHLFPAEAKIESFLTDLAVHANVAPATQNQAMNALVFLYKRVLNHPLQESINAVRADRKINVPVVMTREEVAAVRTISAWHGRKLSRKDRGVKIVKEKNLIKGVPNPDLEEREPFFHLSLRVPPKAGEGACLHAEALRRASVAISLEKPRLLRFARKDSILNRDSG